MNDYDKPWSTDDIRRNASNWSLQSDAKLLEFMQNLSKTLEDRGNRSTQNMHQMLLELNRTKISLENTTNQLMALQHKQFVENRVYDEDETLANTANVPIEEPKETKVTIIDALQNALEQSVNMMDKYFDKIIFNLSDSEDEEVDSQKSVIFQPKDPYKDRPLPYLIGSKNWHEKWHIGLVLSDAEDNSDNENIDAMSESSSDSLSSNIPASNSDSEYSTKATTKPLVKDIFQYSSEENIPEQKIVAKSESSIICEDKVETNESKTESKQFDPINTIFRPQRQIGVSHVAANLIDSEPPELDESPKKLVKEAQKPINLFLEDEDDDNTFDVFDNKKSTVDENRRASKQTEAMRSEPNGSKTEKSAIPKKTINLFAGDDFDDFDSMLSAPTTSKAIKPKVRNLFEDDDPDEDFFLPPTEQVKQTVAPRSTLLSTQPKKDVFLCNLFDDEPPEDDFDVFRKEKTEIKKPITNIFEVPSKSDITDDKIEKKSSIEHQTESSSASIPSKKSSTFDAIRLFDDTPLDDDGQLFSNSSVQPEKSVQPIKKESIKQPGEFYNDFSETIIEAKSTKVMNAVDVEPSPSSPEKDLSIKSQIEEKSPKLVPKSPDEKQSAFSKRLSMFSNSSPTEESSEKTIKTVKQPKKLNLSNIDINVAALLPGAKRSKEKSDANNDSISVSVDSPSTSTTLVHSISQDNVDSSGRLTNLNRSRAKIPNRRPSTRIGRKQQYQKTLDDSDHDENQQTSVDSPDAIFDNHPNENQNISINQPIQISSDSIENEDSSIQIESNVIDFEKEIDFQPNTGDLGQKGSENHAKIDQNSDDEAKEDLDNAVEIPSDDPPKATSPELIDDFEEIAPRKSMSKATPVFFDEIPPELDSSENETFDDPNKKSSAGALLSKNAMSLFQDDGDDDDFEDQLFSAALPGNSDVPQKEDQSNQMNRDPIIESPPKLPTKLERSLFGDDDDESDGDNIFGSSNIVKASGSSQPDVKAKEPILPKIEPKVSLFDDVSDDDNLFGVSTPSSDVTRKPTVKKVAATPSKTNSLFSDSSDDDLFGTKPKGPRTQLSNKKPASSSAKVATVTKPNNSKNMIVDNDPLADLLK